ncbi:serine hydrolase [Candidatus Saccharibacteria bacterium]|nr:serine hydrolase [Candidatus Saccharibacteria bacterium]
MTIHKVRVHRWLQQHKKLLFIATGALLVFIILVQFLYPSDRLVPWQQVDGQAVGLKTKNEASSQLDSLYRARTLALYFGDAKKPQYSPKFGEFGLTVDNAARLERMNYPWYLRLVPTSLLWSHATIDDGDPVYGHDSKKLGEYLQKQLGGSCQVAPVNATAKVAGDKIEIVKQDDGGACKEADVQKSLAMLTPSLERAAAVRVDMEPIPAKLVEKDVQPVVETLNKQLATPITLKYDGKSELVEASTVRSWLVFSTEGDVFDVRFDVTKADAYLQSKLSKPLERAAGVSKVTTHDFVEVSRQDGQSGRRLSTDKTLENIKSYLLAKATTIAVGEAIVPPEVQYTRSYSNTDTGISALIKNFAESHPGTYGASLIELDGKRRRAAFNDTQKFTTASTYKLYVGYSALKRIESGELKWSDQISGGRNLEKCFDDMIVKSDNACAEALVAKIGFRPLTTDAQGIVSGSTTFLDAESYKTTAGDLSTFMASLATGQIPLSVDSKTRFVDALKRNVYRQGIPAGVNGTVADKVGFLDGFLHDAAIVYSPNGTYVLSIMSDKSSWANIAALTHEIEKLRNQ